MKKNLTVQEIEDNMRYGAEVGVSASTNWIVGFPTETTQDFADTLTLIWRIRNFNIVNISPGITMMLSPGAEVTDNRGEFGIAGVEFMRQWTTKNLRNTKLHRMIRQKNFLILLHNLCNKNYIWGFDRPKLNELYTLTFDKNIINDSIPYEKFDYNIIETDISDFADSVVNEIWPLLRTLWRAVGAFEITVNNDPDLDMREWGDRLGCDYSGTQYFKIDAQGNWTADFTYKFKQTPEHPWVKFKWPDFSFDFTWKQQGTWS